MTYKAEVIKVMIASPSDVSAERTIIRDVIYEWNAINAEDRRIVLLPVSWESHSAPAMGDRPQEIINKHVLKGCDLLIAVFWTKFGTPTGKAPSGTAEEIDEHLAAGKPALIYFSSEPVVPESIDIDQYQYLKRFESEKMKMGIIARYENKTEFREKLTRQLSQTIIKEFIRNESDEDDLQASPVLVARHNLHLSDSARELLFEAVKDKNGAIMMLDTLGGSHVETNGRDFVQAGDTRSAAQWRGAVEELERLGFVEDRGGKREVFFVTHRGYDVADRLQSNA